MEGKRSSSDSLASQLFGSSAAKLSSPSSSAGLFSSIFAAPTSVGGKESSRSDIFGPYRKQDDGISHVGQQSKGMGISNKEGQGRSMYQSTEKIDPCSLSSSLYYGGQDFCKPYDSNSIGSSYNQQHSYAKDGHDNSGPAIDSRGDWWQGSLYY